MNALKVLPDSCESREHHVHPEDVDDTTIRLGHRPNKLKFTVLRDPYQQTLSWFGHAILRHKPHRSTVKDFASFIKEYSTGWYFHDVLNPYLLMMDDVIPVPFSKDNLENTLRSIIGHSNRVNGAKDQPAHITKIGGVFSPNPELLNETTTRLIDQRFPRDVELWRKGPYNNEKRDK